MLGWRGLDFGEIFGDVVEEWGRWFCDGGEGGGSGRGGVFFMFWVNLMGGMCI